MCNICCEYGCELCAKCYFSKSEIEKYVNGLKLKSCVTDINVIKSKLLKVTQQQNVVINGSHIPHHVQSRTAKKCQSIPKTQHGEEHAENAPGCSFLLASSVQVCYRFQKVLSTNGGWQKRGEEGKLRWSVADTASLYRQSSAWGKHPRHILLCVRGT